MTTYTRNGSFEKEWGCEKDGIMFGIFPDLSYPIIEKNDNRKVIIKSKDGEELALFECDTPVLAVGCWVYGSGELARGNGA